MACRIDRVYEKMPARRAHHLAYREGTDSQPRVHLVDQDGHRVLEERIADQRKFLIVSPKVRVGLLEGVLASRVARYMGDGVRREERVRNGRQVWKGDCGYHLAQRKL